MRTFPFKEGKIIVKGACEHNLKSVDVEIPHNKLIVVTGVSGSGKSSLAFDIICKEGQRRYLETFSSHARQFLGKLSRPNIESISGLSPAISVDQKSVVKNPRSTVGTMTELHDYLRLLFARLGTNHTGEKPSRSWFSFNSSAGACPKCNGLGVMDKVDPELLISDDNKTLREGALVITTPTGYIVYSQVTMDVLNQVCEANGFNVDIPWKDLTDEQKDIVLNGSDKIKIPYGKHTLESRMKWSGITAKPREEGIYKGILPVIEEILKRDRNKNILRFVRSVKCDECEGARLSQKSLSVKFNDKNIADFSRLSIEEFDEYFKNIKFLDKDRKVGNIIKDEILKRTNLLINLGLGYLTIDRESTTLSGGEAQRIRLATQIGSGLRGMLYVLDEPSIGLHPRDNSRLIKMLRQLVDNGNTVIVVEHDEETMRAADWIVDIGPYAGVNGGELLINSSYSDIRKQSDKSVTRSYLLGDKQIEINRSQRKFSGEIEIYGAKENNLKNIDVVFKTSAINVVSGVSGAGKKSLVHNILSKALRNRLSDGNLTEGKYKNIEGLNLIDKIIEVDQSPIGRTPRSNPATYTKLFDYIRDLFASLPEAKERNWDKGRFSFNNKGGRCEECQGAGVKQVGMHFMGNVDIVCDSCHGKRFNDETLEVKYNGKSIYDVLEMSVDEAVDFFADNQKISSFVKTLQDIGLGYITLGQPSTTLSGGEAQRVKLAQELSKKSTGKTLYILDEPSTGLHFEDINVLLKALNSLVDSGNTIIIIEHNSDIIKAADWVVDLGPESGKNGGELVAIGKPENIINNKASLTGKAINRPFVDEKKSSKEASEDILPISFKGIKTNNLKNIDIDIPVNEITVITGVSGSGKSSLAFDTLFSEGQARYTECLSTYIRTHIAKAGKAEFDEVYGLTSAIAVSQKAAARNPRSTVGTITEIYDYYRLIYSRVGKRHCPLCGDDLREGACGCGFKSEKDIYSNVFSFNDEIGACPDCRGLGHQTVCDPEKLVTNPDLSLIEGALNGTKTGKFYGDPFGQYVAILKTVGEELNIDFSKPWYDLSDSEKKIAMHGIPDKIFNVDWKFKRKNREGVHNFKSEWQGFVGHVNEEYIRKHADNRGVSMLGIMTNVECNSCDGERLKPEYLAVKFAEFNISQLCDISITDSVQLFDNIQNSPEKYNIDNNSSLIIYDSVLEIKRRLQLLSDAGVGYLSIGRTSDTISGGEAQRIRLVSQLGAKLCGTTYVLDEPTIGLHPKDTQKLLGVLTELKNTGNTVVIVEHDRDVIKFADNIIDMGPGAGVNGGNIIAQGSLTDILKNKNSITAEYLNKPLSVNTKQREATSFIKIKGANKNNLNDIDIDFPVGMMTVVSGVSGSGKSSLVFDVLAESSVNNRPVSCKSISGLENFDTIVIVNQKPIGTSPASNPVTYTGVFDKIRDLFAKTDYAKENGFKKNSFSFNVKGGRCETCQGMGHIKVSMDFLADVWTECETCKGKRYKPEVLDCNYNEKSISDVLDMTVAEACDFFSDDKNILKPLEILSEIGLSYLRLGQPANTISGGEAQRLKLANELINSGKGKKLFLFDEPTTGLHFKDVENLLLVFEKLLDNGHTLIVVEHNEDVICNSNHNIDLGPEGGDKGGCVVYTGVPDN